MTYDDADARAKEEDRRRGAGPSTTTRDAIARDRGSGGRARRARAPGPGTARGGALVRGARAGEGRGGARSARGVDGGHGGGGRGDGRGDDRAHASVSPAVVARGLARHSHRDGAGGTRGRERERGSANGRARARTATRPGRGSARAAGGRRGLNRRSRRCANSVVTCRGAAGSSAVKQLGTSIALPLKSRRLRAGGAPALPPPHGDADACPPRARGSSPRARAAFPSGASSSSRAPRPPRAAFGTWTLEEMGAALGAPSWIAPRRGASADPRTPRDVRGALPPLRAHAERLRRDARDRSSPEMEAALGLAPGGSETTRSRRSTSPAPSAPGPTRVLAANYGGHQFGEWAGQLGDGRDHPGRDPRASPRGYL